MKLKPLDSCSRYSNFVNARDRALEKILHWHLSAIDVLIDKTKRKVLALALSHPALVDRELALTSYQIARVVTRLRTKAYVLSHAGEVQAIHNVFGKSKLEKPKSDLGEMPSGGSVDDRIHLAICRLKREIDDALHMSKILGETREETLKRLERAFPPSRPAPKFTTRALSPRRVREAGFPIKAGVYAADDWQEILDDYNATELPDDIFKRGPDDKVVFFDADDQGHAVERYSWEVEQETTEDFVRQVRSGAIDAAKQNGISDFLWNAVLDSHTDECCDVRDGKTSAEIEALLQEGPIDEDGCEAIVAPAHFNCRCKSVPAADDIPDEAPPDFKGFDDWLDQKAKAA